MPHIHKEVENGHDPTASAYIIRDGADDADQAPRLMLHKHRKLGFLLQFGGHVEPNQSPWMAMRDEVQQESGYTFGELKLAQPKQRIPRLTGVSLHPQSVYEMSHHFPGITPPHFHSDRGYLFVAAEPPIHDPDEGESLDIKLYTLEDLRALDDSEILPNVREIGMYCLELYMNLDAVGWELVDPSSFSVELPPAIAPHTR